jgi:hypothetical protein
MHDLAMIWDPKIPILKNVVYLAQSKDVEKQLETALMAALENKKMHLLRR